MPVYIYECATCVSKHTEEELAGMDRDQFGEAALFETIHPVKATAEELAAAVVCPRCDGTDCEKSMIGVKIHGYTRGYGWKDKVGARRDMDVYHLDNQDPYSKHRVPGEVEHVRQGLKDGGKHDPHTKVFVPPREKPKPDPDK
jgi:hypothetical protein